MKIPFVLFLPILLTGTPELLLGQSLHNYFPLAVGNSWTLRSDSLAGVPDTMLSTREIEGTDLINGIEYSRIKESYTRSSDSGGGYWYSWMRFDSTGLVMGAIGDTSLVDSATIFNEPRAWFSSTAVTLGDTWEYYEEYLGGQITMLLVSMDDSITVPAGSFHDCLTIQFSSVDTSSGDTTQKTLMYNAPNVGMVANIGENFYLGSFRLELIEYNVAPLSTEPRSNDVAPGRLRLHTNYPNPFNPGTTIRYDLPEASVVRLIVYDLLGREVVVLVDDYMEPGYHQAQLDGRELPSGIYIARLITPEYAESIKMLLLK